MMLLGSVHFVGISGNTEMVHTGRYIPGTSVYISMHAKKKILKSEY